MTRLSVLERVALLVLACFLFGSASAIEAAAKNAGLLNSKMGLNGGYYLAAPPESISLGQIVRVLDGPLAPIRCVSQMAYEPCGCPDEERCGLRLIMLDVRNAIADILDHTSLADITERVDNLINLPLD